MRDLLEYIVKNLASKPEAVEIGEETADDTINFNLKVDQADMGIVIGKSGQTIKAIRRLLVTRAMSENLHQRVNVTLVEA